ncbi:MAG: acetyltransferase [Negativicutes bacterium]
MKQNKLPVIIIGGGGHAKVVADVLRLQGFHILGFTDIDDTCRSLTSAIPYLGDDSIINQYRPEDILLANGLGSTKTTMARRKIYDVFNEQGYNFACCIHPSAIIAMDVKIDEGTQIMTGVVIQPGSMVGRNVIINTQASVDHDCIIGDHVHVAPGATLSGGVQIASGAHVGTGATVIEGIAIGENSLVGAGSVVIKDVIADTVVVGTPAKEVSK